MDNSSQRYGTSVVSPMFQRAELRSLYGVSAITEVAFDQTEDISFWPNGAQVNERKHGVAKNSIGFPIDLIPDAIFYSRPSDCNSQN